jgi:phosphate transport system substrate-binding protein
MHTKYKLLLGLLAGSLMVMVVGCQAPEGETPQGPVETEPAGGTEGQFTLAGSTTVQPLAEELALQYMAEHPDTVIDVQGGGSSVGITSAGQSTIEIGMASRNVRDSEFEQFPNLQVYTIAYDGIAIVVNPGIELESLTIDQVRQIFAGEITNFSEVGGPDEPIVVVSREEGSGTRGAFQSLVMEAGDEEALITADAILQPSNGSVRTTVAGTPNTISYLSFGFVDDSVRFVAIDGVEPTVENVLDGSYPIFRPLNLLTNGPPGELPQDFLDFVLGPTGQAIVGEDFIPISGDM